MRRRGKFLILDSLVWLKSLKLVTLKNSNKSKTNFSSTEFQAIYVMSEFLWFRQSVLLLIYEPIFEKLDWKNG